MDGRGLEDSDLQTLSHVPGSPAQLGDTVEGAEDMVDEDWGFAGGHHISDPVGTWAHMGRARREGVEMQQGSVSLACP